MGRTKTHKPIYVMCEQGAEGYMTPVIDGINEVLKLASAEKDIEVHNFNVWRLRRFRQNSELIPFRSVDWYVDYGFRESRSQHQVNGGAMFNALWSEPWQKSQPHYDIVVLHSDMYDDNLAFCIGLAIHGFGAVVSVNRFLRLTNRNLQSECIKSETIHEVGHVFGLVPEDRTRNVEESLGKHCTNRCIMRQGLRLPDDWIRLTNDRMDSANPFCSTCQKDLQKYFSS